LVNAVTGMRSNLRIGDILVRWGGEEFLLIMPNTSAQHAHQALVRLQSTGLGSRHDGKPVTASIGLAERLTDHTEAWRTLVELADKRMYEAKSAGRNCIVGCVA
jgi:diguanylate cyclase (GGDEF)-like protein